MFTDRSIYQSIYLYISTYLSMYLFVCRCVYLSLFLSVYRASYVPVCWSVCRCIFLSVESVDRTVCLSVCLPACLSVSLCIHPSFHPSIHLSICRSTYPAMCMCEYSLPTLTTLSSSSYVFSASITTTCLLMWVLLCIVADSIYLQGHPRCHAAGRRFVREQRRGEYREGPDLGFSPNPKTPLQ